MFVIIGTMAVSLLLFSLMFGDTGRKFMWGSMEPIFQSNWDTYTLKDGEVVGEKITETFDNTTEITD